MNKSQYDAMLRIERHKMRRYVNNALSDECERLGYPRNQWVIWRAQDNKEALGRAFKPLMDALSNFRLAVRRPLPEEYTRVGE